MRIRKTLLLLVLMASAATTTVSAQGAFIRLGAGYAFKGATSTFPEPTATRVRANQVSLGKGFNSQLAGGYMFTEYFGAELGLGYLSGSINKLGRIPDLGGDAESHGKMFQIMPSLVVRGGGEKVVPYARFGFVIGFNKAIIEAEGSVDDPEFGKVKTRSEYELTGGSGKGFTAAFGAGYSLTKNLSLYAEANLMQMSWAPEKGRLTRLSASGINLLSELTVSQKETEFVDELPLQGSEPQNPDQPSKQLKTRLPMSNVGFGIGLMYHF